MGLCLSTPHTLAVAIEEVVLEAPYERDLIQGSPVVYVKGKDKLLTFTTVIPQVVGISAIWNQLRYVNLNKEDGDTLEVVVGENPRYRGYIERAREVSGELLVDIDEYNGDENLGNVAVLRIEITQKYAAEQPAPMPVRTFYRKGFEANLSVFVYEAAGLDRSLVRGKKGDAGGQHVDLDLFMAANEELTKVPTPVKITRSPHDDHHHQQAHKAAGRGAGSKDGAARKVGLVWNEGFHFQNLTEEPRFLDLRFNHGSDDESQHATARVDLLHMDVWSKGQDWTWHPVTADDRRDQKFFRILVVDDGDSGPQLERMLTALSTDPLLEADAEAALHMLCEDKFAMLSQFDMIFVNIRQAAGMDGIAFSEKVRAAEKAAGIKPRAIVGMDMPNQQSTLDRDRRCLQAQGINELLLRPLTKSAVRWMLGRFLRNSGLILIDMVVTYTPAGQKGVLGAYQATRARRLRSTLKQTGMSMRLLQLVRGRGSGSGGGLLGLDGGGSGGPALNGMLELRILAATLKDTVPENYSVVFIVTLNHQVMQSRTVKRSKQGTPVLKGTPIEWDEDVHLWVTAAAGEARRLALGVAIYAYPVENDTWHSDDLVGRWSSLEFEGGATFWERAAGDYATFTLELTKSSKKGKVRQKGHLEVKAYVRSAEEIARRQLHAAYQRACDHQGNVSRGEIGRLVALVQPLIHNEAEARQRRKARRHEDSDDEDAGAEDNEDDDDEKNRQKKKKGADGESTATKKKKKGQQKKGSLLGDSSSSSGSDTDDDVVSGRRPEVLARLDRFVRNGAHYTHNGQTDVNENMLSEMVDLRTLSQIK